MNRLERGLAGPVDVAVMVGELVSSYFGHEASPQAQSISRSGPLVHASWEAGSASEQAGKMHFVTFAEASVWARQNPGRIITPAPQGEGYVGR